METNKFKVGDKVRVIDASGSAFTEGDLAAITHFDPNDGTWGCRRESDPTLRQWFTPSQLEHIGTPIPAPEIVVEGHTYRLVKPEAPEPKAGQIWKQNGFFMVIVDKMDDKDPDAVALNGQDPGLPLNNRFNGKGVSPRPTFIAHSLREALESGKIKAEDL